MYCNATYRKKCNIKNRSLSVNYRLLQRSHKWEISKHSAIIKTITNNKNIRDSKGAIIHRNFLRIAFASFFLYEEGAQFHLCGLSAKDFITNERNGLARINDIVNNKDILPSSSGVIPHFNEGYDSGLELFL